jgi:hypothetical protein
MYRDEGVGLGWTKWYAIAGEDLAPGEGNAANMNAAIPNGQSGIALESTRGHGLCGDRGDRRAFMKGGPYGPTSFRSGSYQSGGLLPVQISVKAYHAGWSVYPFLIVVVFSNAFCFLHLIHTSSALVFCP